VLAVCSQAFGSFQGQSHEAIPPERRAENQRNDKINWEQRLDLETLAKPEKQHTLGRDPVGWLWCHQSIRASVQGCVQVLQSAGKISFWFGPYCKTDVYGKQKSK
jgi:23S rRNA A1618 N6-methylase RlmF